MFKKLLKKGFSVTGLVLFTLLTLIVSAVFVSIKIFFAPGAAFFDQTFESRVKSDYVLMVLQCVSGIVAILLPSFLARRVRLVFPSAMIVGYVIFLYCSIYLGEVRSFYYTVPHWDSILHGFSGIMLGALGFSVISFLNGTERVPINLSPIFIACFTFCFAITLDVIWEVYEFTADSLFATNMQKYALESGELLAGRAAVMDTMKDLVIDCIGAFLLSAFGFIMAKYKQSWIEKIQVKKMKAS